jgi:hypothetical protein
MSLEGPHSSEEAKPGCIRFGVAASLIFLEGSMTASALYGNDARGRLIVELHTTRRHFGQRYIRIKHEHVHSSGRPILGRAG